MSDASYPTDIYGSTTSLCSQCLRSVPARIHPVDGTVILEKTCTEHGTRKIRICGNSDWYERTLAWGHEGSPPETFRNPEAQGCPFDCGSCSQHRQRLQLPILPITSACNLSCPICYTHNKNDGAFHLTDEALDAILQHLERLAPERRILNITGGEPTAHPNWLEIVRRCSEAGVRRVTVSTHGMQLSDDDMRSLQQVDARVILSFDSMRDATNQAMLGGRFTNAKRAVLERLGQFGVPTTLLPVIARGHNDDEVGTLVELGLSLENVRSIELHTMTFTGQYGRDFIAEKYGPWELLSDLEEQTEGALRVDDFCPGPSSHPLCYQVAYLLSVGERWTPFARFLTHGEIRQTLRGSLYLEAGPQTEAILQNAILELWTGARECSESSEILAALRGFCDDIYAPGLSAVERMQRAESHVKAVYVHAHMDEDDFDTDRIQQCCVSIVEPDGRTLPSCAYNVLYRARDERFSPHPLPPLETLGDGRHSESH